MERWGAKFELKREKGTEKEKNRWKKARRERNATIE